MASNELGQSRALLLAMLVVVGTGGAIFVMGRGESDEAAPQKVEEAPEQEALEVTPLLTPGAIKTASWREEGEEEAPEGSNLTVGREESLLDRLGDEDDMDSRFEKSLETTVEPINGLGVYVAPAEKKKARKD